MLQKLKQKRQTKAKFEANIMNQIALNKGRQIQFFNFWDQPYEEIFWTRFLKARPELLNNKLKYGFYSVFGDRAILDKTETEINVFYTAENLKVKNYFDYLDHYLTNGKIDLALGFEYFEHEKYVRFPNWMDVFFLKTNEVKEVCNRLRFPNVENKDRFASCVASHGKGLRESIIDSLNSIEQVSCPGKFRHNDDSLINQYNDDKLEYLKRFQFNICPENSNALGYVTEKLFQAISVGCIPIYWGSYNRPELDVLNQDAIIFWNPEGDNTDAIKLINDLHHSPKLMKEFLSQPRLLSTADEHIQDTFLLIENKLNELIKLSL